MPLLVLRKYLTVQEMENVGETHLLSASSWVLLDGK